MPINKQHKEFYKVDVEDGFELIPGYPEGFKHKILVGFLDEENNQGGRTRVLKIAPGTFTTEPFVHEYFEEVWLIEGDLWVGNDAEGKGGEKFGPGTYACRPPGAAHGPFRTEGGAMLLESHYFDESGK